MARVTIEDCLQHVENRFKLVLLASARARQLSHGATEFVSRGKDKDTVYRSGKDFQSIKGL